MILCIVGKVLVGFFKLYSLWWGSLYLQSCPILPIPLYKICNIILQVDITNLLTTLTYTKKIFIDRVIFIYYYS